MSRGIVLKKDRMPNAKLLSLNKIDKDATILLKLYAKHDIIYDGFKGLPKKYFIDGGNQNVRKSCH